MEKANTHAASESKLHFLDYWRIIRIRKFVILSVFLLVVTTTTLVTLWMPKKYASKARIAVEKDVTDVGGLAGQQISQAFDHYFIQTQFERIQSKEVLDKVIEEMGLNEKWATRYGSPVPFKTKETFVLLGKRLDVRQVRNTSLIEIRVMSERPDEAAAIANKIAEVYRSNRLEKRMEMSMGGIKKYKEELDSQNQKVQAKQDEVDRLRKELSITEFSPESGGPTATLEPQTLRQLEAERVMAQRLFVEADTKVSKLKGLTREELRKSILTVNFDDPLARLLNDLTQAEQQLAIKLKDYSENHPEVIRASAVLDKINRQIEDRLDGIMTGLDAQAATLKAGLDAVTKAKEDALAADIEKAEKSRPYFQAKRDLERELVILDVLARKITVEGIDATLPKSAVVEIIDHAEEALRPVFPNIPLNVALGIIVGLVAGVGLAFFIEYLDTSMKTIDEIEHALQAPVVGVIPQNVGSLLEEGPESPHAEAYRVLRTSVLFARKDEKANTFTIVSGGAGEGKSTTAFNLAAIFAQGGNSVLLVDSDLRRPSLHKLFNVSNAVGLTDHLLEQKSLEEVIQKTPLKELEFLPSGKLISTSLGILNSKRMREFIRQVKGRYDFVFFDAPPILGVSDASVLASEMDMTLLVIQYRKYPQAMAMRAKQMVEKVGGNLLGVVLNNINLSQDSYYYYYGGYNYGHDNRAEENTTKANGKPRNADREGARLNLEKRY